MSLYCDITKKLGKFTLNVKFETEDETVALMGSSGCGKSMTLRCIAGIQRPDQGKIIINGTTVFDSEKKIDLAPQKRRTGFLFQDYALFPNMTVESNIKSVLAKEKWETLPQIMETYHLHGLEKQFPRQLSGGQKQRCALARMLVTEPEIILLDEPFSALDSYLRWQMEQEVSQAIRGFGKSVIFVSHDRDEVYRLSDRVVVIHKGRNEPISRRQDLYQHPRTYVDALLTGCKNICNAKKENGRLQGEEFGITLDPAKDFEQADYIGIRSKMIQPSWMVPQEIPAFRSDYIVEQVMEGVFTYVLMVRLPGAQSALRWEMSKEVYQQCDAYEAKLAIPYQNILILQEGRWD
ncbi:MAG: sulfate/molybdate ABC transporter ATP-binding protein [Lachnospiraceae bacterium]